MGDFSYICDTISFLLFSQSFLLFGESRGAISFLLSVQLFVTVRYFFSGIYDRLFWVGGEIGLGLIRI